MYLAHRTTATSIYHISASMHAAATYNIPDSLPITNRDFGLGSVKHLLELADTVPHSRMHIGLRAFNVVVQIVTEILDMTDCRERDLGVGKVTREQNESNIANVFSLCEIWEVPELERRVSRRIEDLWCALNSRESSSVDEFLEGCLNAEGCIGSPGGTHLQEDLAKYPIRLLPEHS